MTSLDLSASPSVKFRLPSAERLWWLTVLAVAATLTITSWGCSPTPETREYPMLGKTPIEPVYSLENHGDALTLWASHGIRNGTLIHVDAHDDLRWRAAEHMAQLKVLYAQGDVNGLREASRSGDSRLYDMGSFLYAAAHLGIIKEVYWVIPYPIFNHADSDEQMYSFLRSCRLTDRDIEGFSSTGGCYCGEAFGIPLHICSPEQLPALDQPVVLSIDADFFPKMAEQYGTNLLEAVGRLFTQLHSRAYRVETALVSYSVNGNYLPLAQRWLGDWVLRLLREPEVFGESHPETGMIFQHVQHMLGINQAETLLSYLEGTIARRGEDPALHLYAAYAHYELGHVDQAFASAERSCLMDHNYCGGLADLGLVLATAGHIEEGVRFFARAYERNPDMLYHVLAFADLLVDAGYPETAMTYYKKYSEWFGTSPVGFLIADLYDATGDHDEALAWYDRALAAFLKDPYSELWRQPIWDALNKGLLFYEKHGYPDRVRQIRENPRIRYDYYANLFSSGSKDTLTD